jgi:AraC-like DNA-binding protein
MRTELPDPTDPLLPGIARGVPAELAEKLQPLALLHPLDADLWLRVDGEGRVRVARGELFALLGGGAAVFDRRQTARDVLLFRAGWPWVVSALRVLGLDASGQAGAPTPGAGMWIEPAGSDLTRRAARLLAGARLTQSRAPETATRLEHAARWIELVAVAFAARREPPASRSAARSALRGAFLNAVETLRSEPLEACTLPRFAARLGISERHASRLFQQWIGTSFQQHVAGLRLERAKRLLATTDLPITEVALEAGWRSLSHFNSVFRRRTALTPGAYRSTASPRDLIEIPPPVDPT